MCKNPSPLQVVEMIRLEELSRRHREQNGDLAQKKAQLVRENKEAAKNVLLGIQLQLARRTFR